VKIVKQGNVDFGWWVERELQCDRCGTRFELDPFDDVEIVMRSRKPLERQAEVAQIKCPYCATLCWTVK